MDCFLSLAKSRRSIRQYSEEKVPHEKVEKVLEAGAWAPSAHNAQPWRFVVLEDEGRIAKASAKIKELLLKAGKKLRETEDPIFYKAPCVVIICIENPMKNFARNFSEVESQQTFHSKGEYVDTDIGMCAQNCLLQAEEMGLSSCPIGRVSALEQSPETKRELGIPDNWEVMTGFCLGYGKDQAQDKERKKPEVKYIR